MAEYSFGRNILQYIQNQDELNLRAKQLETEEERYKVHQSYQNRQAQLVGARWQADYDLKIAKEYADQENAFNKDNTILNALPEDVRSQIPTEAYKYKGENIYVPNEAVTNIEQGNERTLNIEKEKNDEAYRVEQLKNVNDSEANSWANTNETKRYHDYLMTKDGSDKKQAANEKIYSTNLALANDNLTKLKAFNSKGTDSNLSAKDYAKFKGDGTKAVGKLLTVVGLSNSDLDYVREGALLDEKTKSEFKLAKQKADGDSEWAKTNEWAQMKREFYNSAIYSLEDKVTEEELEVLKLWNDVGTR